MAKYKITNINEAKGHVTFQVTTDAGAVILTDTRGDLPIEDKDAVDAELSRFALSVETGQTARKADARLTAILNVAQAAKTEAV